MLTYYIRYVKYLLILGFAGDEGIEPSPKVLETFVLPLN
jgi:hypothetical protein